MSGKELMQNDDEVAQKVPAHSLLRVGSAQVPLTREKLRAWKETAGGRGALPVPACELEGRKPTLFKMIRGKHKTFSQTETQNQD